MIAHAAALALFLSAPGLPLAEGPDTLPLTLPGLLANANIQPPAQTAKTNEAAAEPQSVPVAMNESVPALLNIKSNAVAIGPDSPDRYILTQTITPSPDSGSVTYRHRFGFELALDGVALNGENYLTVVNFTDPVFSPDSKSLAFVIRESGNGWRLYHKRQMILGHEPVTSVKYSPNGQRLIYLAREGKKRLIVETDRSHPHADAVDWDRLIFTNDSTVLAYPAIVGGAWRMVINGDPGPAWERIVSVPVTGSAGPNVYFVAHHQGRYHVVDRHTPGPGHYQIDTPPVVSDDGKTFAYWAMGDDLLWRIYRNNKPVPGYDADRPGQLVMSHDGKSLAAILKRGDGWLVVHNGQPGPAFSAVGQGSLLFSSDGSRLAYAVRKQLGWAVIVDHQEQQTFAQLGAKSLRFSPDSQRFVYAALNGGLWSVVESESGGAHHQPGFNQLDTATLAFSPDSQRLAYVARNGGWPSVILDGEVLGEYENAQHPTFSPTSEHLVYIATQNDTSQLYADGVPAGDTFKELVPGARIHFTSKTTCQTVAIRRPGPTFWRIELDLTPAPVSPRPDQDGTPAPATPEPTSPDPSFVGVPTE